MVPGVKEVWVAETANVAVGGEKLAVVTVMEETAVTVAAAAVWRAAPLDST
jgi:hypothetical protein